MSLWQEVRSNVIEWYTVAAEKTETWAQLGVRHYDRYGIHRKLGKEFAQLGGEVHALLREGQFADLAEREAIRPILQRIEELETEMREKESEIAEIREGTAERKTSENAEDAAAAGMTEEASEPAGPVDASEASQSTEAERRDS